MKNKKQSRKGPENWIGFIGSLLVLIGIVGGFISDFFAFWKFEGNVPSIIDGGIFFLPFNMIKTNLTGIEPVTTSESYLFLIYLPFSLVAILGLMGSYGGSRFLSIIGSIIGLIAVPLSIYLIMLIMGSNGFIYPGTELSGLFNYNQITEEGTYSIGLWTGSFLCIIGTYLLTLDIPKSKKGVHK